MPWRAFLCRSVFITVMLQTIHPITTRLQKAWPGGAVGFNDRPWAS